MRSSLRFASIVGAFALSTVAITPAMAAAPVSQAGANAVYLAVAGNGQGTGTVTATNDGSGEKKNNVGTAPTVVGALGNNPVLKAGVAAQDATAGVADGAGNSAACAGLAGEDGSVVKIGSGNCLKPGKALTLSLANLDLSNTTLIQPGTALDPLTSQLLALPVGQTLGTVTAAIEDAIAGTPLGEIGLSGNFGALQARCTASPGTAQGTANLANTSGDDQHTPITLSLPGGTSVILAKIPVNPAPNTKVVTGLDTVTQDIVNALKTQFNDALDGVAAPLDTVVDAIQDQLVTNLVAQLQPALQPLEQQVLDITLNKQTHPTPDSIKVNALDLQLLPAAQAAVGSSLVNLQIGNVACGPSGRVASSAAVAAPEAPAALPTSVSAGYAAMPGQHAGQGDDSSNAIVLGAFALLMAGAAGFISFRRLHR
jgi:hypothetical protein